MYISVPQTYLVTLEAKGSVTFSRVKVVDSFYRLTDACDIRSLTLVL